MRAVLYQDLPASTLLRRPPSAVPLGIDRLELAAVDHRWLEGRAEELKVYATMLVPEPLQSRDNAETVIRRTHDGSSPASISKVDKLVREHLARQEVLDDKPPKRLTVLMEQQVLNQPVGGQAVLRQQLEHLVRAVKRPHVKVRLVPPADWHEGVYGPFVVCVMERPYPSVALVEHLGGRLTWSWSPTCLGRRPLQGEHGGSEPLRG